MNRLGIVATGLLLALGSDGCAAAPGQDATAKAEAQTWDPGGGLKQVPLWPEGVALARPETTGPENTTMGEKPVAGRPLRWVWNVTRPTMTVFPAKGRNTGAAVLVFPGGGYQGLAIDLEGTEVCDWLTPRGVTCIVLKYRVPGSGHHWDAKCKCARMPAVPMALQDAQRAMVLLRQRAREFGIDPNKIGVAGFSAGGHLVTAVSNADALSYAAVDDADRLDSRPNFGIALYPGHLWTGKALGLHPFNHISKHAPPQLIVQAEDDPVDDVRNSIVYYLALLDAGVPAEMHLYAHGGHAFALRRTEQPITRWPELAERWLHTIGMVPTE